LRAGRIKGVGLMNAPKFIVDHNVGKLTKWLRIMGYDTRFFNGTDDADLVAMALAEGRVILTRDTQIMKRGVVTLSLIHISEPTRPY